ncbi:amino acid permease [Variovorax sp. dw_954]|uniref:APC family permease n=1 Tax=Variovorax sp. dw_954 TaxID=2720078 RepID=UPI001BD4E74F|nr:amino acid permease [Variovorax sp. dw_954]
MGLIQNLLRTKGIDGDAGEQGAHGGAGLAPSFGLFSLTMLGVGATIGTGIFFVMAEAVPKAGPAVLLAFLLAGFTAGLTALCYAELAASIPASGSSYSYAYVGLGEFAAYIVAACLMLEYALSASATAIGWSGYLNNFLVNLVGVPIPEALRSPMLVLGEQGLEIHTDQFNLPPVILVGLCGLLLLRGARESATANAIMVMLKLAVLIFFSVVALTAFKADNFTPFFNEAGMKGVTAAAGTVFFSFIGLDAISTAGAEVRNPKRNVPLGIVLALIIVMTGYVIVAMAALGAQPASEFAHQEAGLAVILQKVTGHGWPSVVLSAGAVISVFSVTLVAIYGQTRILFAIARDGLIPRTFQQVNPRTLAPVNNIVYVCIGVAIVAGTVDSSYLWDMVSMGTLVAFMAVSASVPVVRARLKAASTVQGFRLPLGPYLIPGLSIAACCYILKDLSHATYVVFFSWIAVSLVAYFGYGMRHSNLARAATRREQA